MRPKHYPYGRAKKEPILLETDSELLTRLFDDTSLVEHLQAIKKTKISGREERMNRKKNSLKKQVLGSVNGKMTIDLKNGVIHFQK